MQKIDPEAAAIALLRDLFCCRCYFVLGSAVNEYKLKNKQNCKNIHRRSDFLKVTADNVEDNVSNHTEQDAIGNGVGEGHHNHADKSGN